MLLFIALFLGIISGKGASFLSGGGGGGGGVGAPWRNQF